MKVYHERASVVKGWVAVVFLPGEDYNEGMKIRRIVRKKGLLLALVIILALAGLGIGIALMDGRAGAPQAKAVVPKKSATKPSETKPAAPVATNLNKTKFSTSDPASLWVIVNKQHPLAPLDYTPSDFISAYGHQVSSRMVYDLTALMNAATSDDVGVTVISSYRSYSYQVNLYNSYVAEDGQAKADTYSARAGYSEHQTGLAIDFGNKAGTCAVQNCYADTPEGKWLAANAYKYGFLLRYTAEKQSVTGYEAEAWHYRYIGKDLSTEMHTSGLSTLEEFFNITGGAAYN